MPELIITDRDLTDPENLKQARFELDRCDTEAMFSTWAQRWGRAALTALENLPDPEEIIDLMHDVEFAEADAKAATDNYEMAHEKLIDANKAIRAARNAIAKLTANTKKYALTPSAIEALDAITEGLDA